MTVGELLNWGKNQSDESGVSSAEQALLLQHVLQFDAAKLILKIDDPVDVTNVNRFKDLLAKRAQGIPIAYLTSSREFWSLPLYVDERVLIPRHETETVVERVLLHAKQFENPKILELGTGSGAIALALASELPNCEIVATDISSNALDVAEQNRNSLSRKNVRLVQSNWFKTVGETGFDIICSNPPYVREDDHHLDQGDLRFEPRNALVAKNDGLSDITTIVESAKDYLNPGGWLVLEHGYDQARSVQNILTFVGYGEIQTICDLSGNNRVTEGVVCLSG